MVYRILKCKLCDFSYGKNGNPIETMLLHFRETHKNDYATYTWKLDEKRKIEIEIEALKMKFWDTTERRNVNDKEIF